MHKYAKELMEEVKTCIKGRGTDTFHGQELEELKIWSEIAKNIVCFDKDYKIVEAMEEDKQENERMGYRRRDSMGRFVRGYTKPYLYMNDDEWIDEYMNNPDFEKNARMGYMPDRTREMPRRGYENPNNPNMNYMDNGNSKYGYSYDGWREAKRHYTETHNQEHKNKMDKYTKDHVNSMIDSARDMWAEADPALRESMKKDFTQFVQGLN